MLIKMKGKRSFVKRFESISLESSLIEVIEFNPDQSQFAMILATDHPDLKICDHVIIGKYSGSPYTFNDVEGFIVEEDDVLAIIE